MFLWLKMTGGVHIYRAVAVELWLFRVAVLEWQPVVAGMFLWHQMTKQHQQKGMDILGKLSGNPPPGG
jgi:hypothetical protein